MASMRQRVIKLLLQRTFGSLLERPLDAEQLGANFLDGFVELNDIELSSHMLRRCTEGLPMTVSSASVAKIRINIPRLWSLSEDLSAHCTVEISGLHIKLSPSTAEQYDSQGRNSPTSFTPASSPSAVAASETLRQTELERQRETDAVLKRLLLETELVFTDTRVSLCAANQAEVSVVLNELRVNNASGQPSTLHHAKQDELDLSQRIMKRIELRGLRVQLENVPCHKTAPVTLAANDAGWNVVQLEVNRQTHTQTTIVNVHGDFCAIRCALGPLHTKAIGDLVAQFVASKHIAKHHPAQSSPTPLAAVRGGLNLAAAGALTLSESQGSEDFYDDWGDPELSTAAADMSCSLHDSLVGFAGTVEKSSLVWNVKLRCRRASITLLYGLSPDQCDIKWLDVAPGIVDPPTALFDDLAEGRVGHICLTLGGADSSESDESWGLELHVPGNLADSDDRCTDLSWRIAHICCDEYLCRVDGASEYRKAQLSCADTVGTTCGLTSSIYLSSSGETFVKNRLFCCSGSTACGRIQTPAACVRKENSGNRIDTRPRYSIELQPVSFALDCALPSRLSSLWFDGLPGSIEAEHDERADNISVAMYCPRAVGQVHFMLPGSVTPCVEFLQLTVEKLQLLTCKTGHEHNATLDSCIVELSPFEGRPVEICRLGIARTDQGTAVDRVSVSVADAMKLSAPGCCPGIDDATRDMRGKCIRDCIFNAHQAITICVPELEVKLSNAAYQSIVCMLKSTQSASTPIGVPEPEPEVSLPAFDWQTNKGIDTRENIVRLLLERTASILTGALTFSVTVKQGTICLDGEMTVAEDHEENSNDVGDFQPYDDSDSDDYAVVTERFKYRFVLERLCAFHAAASSNIQSLGSYMSISAATLAVFDDEAQEQLICTEEVPVLTAKLPTALLIDICNESGRPTTTIIEGCGLRISPQWHSSVPMGGEPQKMPSLNLRIATHLSTMFDSDSFEPDASVGHSNNIQIYNLHHCAVELGAPLAQSTALLHIERLSLLNALTEIDVALEHATLHLANRRVEPEQCLWTQGGDSCEIVQMRGLSANATLLNPNSSASRNWNVKSTIQGSQKCPAIRIRTCADSLATMLNFLEEVSDGIGERQIPVRSARSTHAPNMPAPSMPQHRSAVFKDSQVAWIQAAAPEPVLAQQSTADLQMQTITWQQSDDAENSACAAALQRSDSVGSDGFVDLGNSNTRDLGYSVQPPRIASPASMPTSTDTARLNKEHDTDSESAEPVDLDLNQFIINSFIDFQGDCNHHQTLAAHETNSTLETEKAEPCGNLIFISDGDIVWNWCDGMDWGAESRGAALIEIRLREVHCVVKSCSARGEEDSEVHLSITCKDISVLDLVQSSQIEYLLRRLQTTPGRSFETSSQAVRLDVSSSQAQDKSGSLLKIKLQLAPLRLAVNGRTYRRLGPFWTAFNSDIAPALPRPDDALFQTVEIGGIVVRLDWVPEIIGFEVLHDFPLTLLPVKVCAAEDTLGGGAPLAGLPEWILTLWINECKRKLPATVMNALPHLGGPIPHLARVGAAAAAVVTTPAAAYRKSGNIEHAATRLATELPKFVGVIVKEVADATHSVAGMAHASLQSIDDMQAALGRDLQNRATGRSEGVQQPLSSDAALKNSEDGRNPMSQRAATPLLKGFEKAGASMSQELHVAQKGLIQKPLQTCVSSSASNADVAFEVIRGVQVAVMRPLIGATNALAAVSAGVRDSFDPQRSA